MTYHETLRNHLKYCVVVVEFIKKDGSHRRMKCTLNETLIPPKEYDTRPRAARPENLISVYDLDVDGWRTINADTITLWQVKPTIVF